MNAKDVGMRDFCAKPPQSQTDELFSSCSCPCHSFMSASHQYHDTTITCQRSATERKKEGQGCLREPCYNKWTSSIKNKRNRDFTVTGRLYLKQSYHDPSVHRENHLHFSLPIFCHKTTVEVTAHQYHFGGMCELCG